jgi:hypothetical protein
MLKRLLFYGMLPHVMLICSQKIYSQNQNSKIDQFRKHILADAKVSFVQMSDERQTPTLIAFKQKAQLYNKSQAASLLSDYLSLRTGVDNLVITRQTTVYGDIDVIEFQQYYKGIKVEHGGFKALVKDNNIQLFDGAWYDVPPNLMVNPSIIESLALSKAKAKVGARKYAGEEVNELIE